MESRRGGGGYIRISRVRQSPRELLMHTVNSVGSGLDCATATAFVSNIYETGIIDKGTARLILAAVGDKALRPIAPVDRDTVRASIFKQLMINLICE